MADVSRFIQKADEALKKRNYDYAIQMYQEALLVDPKSAEARRNFRLALVRKYDEKGYPKGLKFGGLTVALKKDPKQMLAEMEKLIVKDPKSIKYNQRIAQVLMDIGAHDGAVAVLEFMVKYCDVKSEKNAQTFKLLAKAYVKADEPQKAQAVLSRAARVVPNDKEIKVLQKEISAKSYNKQVGSAKSSYDLVKNRDEAAKLEAARKGVMSDADADTLIAEEEAKLQANPLDRRAIRQIGELLAKKKKFNEAYERLIKFVEVDPSAGEVGELAAKYKNQYFDALIRTCKAKAQQDPSKAAAYEAKINEIEQAKKDFRLKEYGRQVEAAPTDLEKRFRFGQALFDAGHAAKAFKHFQKAHKSPKFAKHTGLYMGRCLIEMDRIEMAEQQFKNLEKELSDTDEELSKELMYFTADLLEKKGDPAGALDKFRSLFLEDAEFRDIEARIDRLKAATG